MNSGDPSTLLKPEHYCDDPTDNPLVSTIVLSYNQSRFVLETLESVKAQTYKATQLIIVDDCSLDDSVATIDHWLQESGMHCEFIRHKKNLGICKSLNEALAVANGKYISMVASDDVWLPDKIEWQVEIMESQPNDVGVLYSDALQIDENGHVLPSTFIETYWNQTAMPQGRVLNALLQGNFIPGLTALIRRSCYDEVGVYDENLPWEDWDMWMRIARRYSFLYSSTPSAKYRHHEKSLSHSNPRRMLKDSFRICLKQFHLGDLKDDQKTILIGTLLNLARELYNRNDPDAPNILLDLWQATRNTKAVWMYQFARLGVSYRNFQRADTCRIKLRSFLGKVAGN
jgi:glycosyltransferase involved in cell wall biosynthesis